MNGKRGFTERLAGFSTRHAWPVLGVWVLLLVGAFLLAGNMDLTDGGVATTDAARARTLVDENRGADVFLTFLTELVLIEAPEGTIDEPLFESVVASVVAEIRAVSVVSEVASYQGGAASLRTVDGRYALIQITSTITEDDDDFAEGNPILAVI